MKLFGNHKNIKKDLIYDYKKEPVDLNLNVEEHFSDILIT